MEVSIRPSTQDKYSINALDTIHINPSVLEGENIYSSPLGFRKARCLEYFAPQWLIDPYITGDLQIYSIINGKRIYSDLICNPGIIKASERAKLTYQWYHKKNNKNVLIPNANKYIYKLRDEDYDIPLFCRITATNRSGTLSRDTKEVIPDIISSVENTEFLIAAIIHPGSGNRQEIIDSSVNTISGLGSKRKEEVHTKELYAVWSPVFHKELVIPNHNAESGVDNWGVNEQDITTQSTSPSPSEGSNYFAPGITHSGSSFMYQIIDIPSEDHNLISTGKTYVRAWWRQYQKETGESYNIDLELQTAHPSFFHDDLYVPIDIIRKKYNTGYLNKWYQMNTPLIVMSSHTRAIIIRLRIVSSGNSSSVYFDDFNLEMYKENE